MTPHSRGRICPSFASVSPSKAESAGNAGCLAHPQPRVQWQVAHALVTTGSPKQSGIPLHDGLQAYSALSPECRAC
jgi:hypothetical protein